MLRLVGSVATVVAIGAVVVGALVADGEQWLPLQVSLSVVAGLAVVLVGTALHGVETAGQGLLVLAVGTATWNGLTVGGLQIAHAALAGALVLLAGAAIGQRRPVAVPAWVWILAGAIVLVAGAAMLWPTAPGYLTGRVQLHPEATVLPSFDVLNVLNAVRWLVAVVALPVAACLAVARRPRLAGILASGWTLGAVANAAVAVTDEFGLSTISAQLLSIVDVGGRQAGLGAHPNHLAMAVALVAPVATWRLLTASSATARWGWLGAAAVLAGGLLVSGSRGGLAGTVLGVGITVLALAAGRRLILPLVGALLVAAVGTVTVAPEGVGRVAEALRLSGAESAQASNDVRALVLDQALLDVEHSPVLGIGLPVIVEGHSIYLQLLAAGGLLLFLAFLAAMTVFARDAWALGPLGGLPTVLLTSTVVWLVVGVVENHLTDVFLYVPLAIVAGLRAAHPPAGEAPPVPLVVTGRGGLA